MGDEETVSPIDPDFRFRFVPGARFRITRPALKRQTLFHVRAVVDGDIVVVRTWIARWQWWEYSARELSTLWTDYQAGRLAFA